MPDSESIMAEAFQRFHDQEAIVWEQRTLSYEEYSRATVAASAILVDHSVSAHDRVAIIAEPCWRYPVLLRAIWSLGAVAVPINHRLPEDLRRDLLDQSQCCLAVHDSSCSPPVAGQTISLLAIENTVRSDNFRSSAPARTDVIRAHSDPATILFTSGSSGTHKAVVHTLTHHIESALASNDNIKLALGDRWLATLPFHHVAGLSIIFRTMLAGAAIVIPESQSNPAQAMDDFSVTHLSLVAVQLDRMLRSQVARQAEAKLSAVLVGGSAIPAELISDAHRRGWPIFTTYGSTEMASQITTTKPGAPLSELQTSGRPLKHCDVRIKDSGEILVKGKSLALGYLSDATIVPVSDREGWFASGDLGEIDSKGRLIVRGRRDRMFISGGENIHPEVIEAAVARLQGIRRVCVFGVPDPEYGMRPIGVVEFDTTEPEREQDLRVRLRDGLLPGYLVPDRFYRWSGTAETGGLKTDLTTIVDLWRRGDLTRLK